jgi:dTDP-4-dehydrorhamnose reductase
MRLFILGLGYSAAVLARHGLKLGWQIGGSVREAEKALALKARGIDGVAFDADKDDAGGIAKRLRGADALLLSIPPGAGANLLPTRLEETIAREAHNLAWIGYLSTIGVYGDHDGAWIDETTPCTPLSERSKARLAAEQSWARLGEIAGKPVILFRLPGIYGPSRNALASLREGTAKRIVKPGQVFNRIHVDDIAAALAASIRTDASSAVYNVTDDEPAPPQDVVRHAAELLGLEPPPEVPFDEARLSPMAASFYAENKRVRNALIKRAIDFSPAFPSYREGLAALLALGEGRTGEGRTGEGRAGEGRAAEGRS